MSRSPSSRRLRRVLLATIAAAGFGLLHTATAFAWGPVIVEEIMPTAAQTITQPIIGAINSNGSHTVSQIRQNDNDIVNAVHKNTEQGTVNNAALMKYLNNLASAEDSRNVLLRTQQFTLHATDQAQSGNSACNVITGAIAGGSINAAVSQYQAQGTQAELAWLNGGDKQTPAPSFNGSNAAISAAISAHCANSATEADIESGLCPKGTKINAMANSGPGSTVSPDVDAGALFDSDTQVVSKQTASAAGQMMAMIFAPQPMGAMPAGSATTQQGRTIAYQRMVSQAQSSAPYSIAMGIEARKMPLADQNQQVVSGDSGSSGLNSSPISLASWAKAEMSQLPGHTTAPAGGYFPNGVSEDAWLKLRAEGWFMNPNWVTMLNGDSEVQAVKDGVMINAYGRYLQDKQYGLQEEEVFLLSEIATMLQHHNESTGTANQ